MIHTGPRIRQWPIPLVAAESRLTITVERRERSKQTIILEWAPAAYSGNTPGIQFDIEMPAAEAAHLGAAMEHMARTMSEGRGVVEGKEYGRHQLNLAGGRRARILVFLTEEDCRTIGMVLDEALNWAK